jgi:16S rRNA (cytosine967-C5)-methyltransferase
MNTPGVALSLLLEHTADVVQAVRGGRSLNELLPRQSVALRPGVQALAFHVLRHLGGAMEVRQALAPRNPPPAVDSLLVCALALLWPVAQPPYTDHTLVDQTVHAARRRVPAAAAFINAVLRRFLRERTACVQAAQRTPQGAFNHPAWWVQRLRDDWPGQAEALLAAANRHPPMTLRVNARRLTAAAYLQRLAEAGLTGQLLPGPLLGGQAIALARPVPVQRLPGFAAGDVSVQDAAAQMAARLLLGQPSSLAQAPSAMAAATAAAAHVDPFRLDERLGAGPSPASRPLSAGARVLDACAAPGGKTAHLLELADLDLLALDADAARLVRVSENLGRLQLRARLLAGDAREPQTWWDGKPFDAILLDAPCTASGIVRRHPDVRWLRRPEDIRNLARTQAQLLSALWPLLAPGGRLLYATCSLFKAEGQTQIDAFLQRVGTPAARLLPQSPGHLLPLPDNAASGTAAAPGERGALEAAASGIEPEHSPEPPDGFFYALIEKT